MKHRSSTVLIGEDPEYGPLYRCLHDPDCTVTEAVDGVQTSFVADRHRSYAPECVVFRCLEQPTRVMARMKGDRRVEFSACETHGDAIDAGEPYCSAPGNKLYMGDDYRLARPGESGQK